MNYVRLNQYGVKTSGGRVASTTALRDRNSQEESDMQKLSERDPDMDRVQCPQCGAPGFASTIRVGAFQGQCGSRWFELGGIETSAACLWIEYQRDQIDELAARVAELDGGAVAA